MPSPKRSHAKPSRGSISIGLVVLNPVGVLGSLPTCKPLFGLPLFGAIAPTGLAVGPASTKSWAVIGAGARRDAVGHVAGGVKATAQAGSYNATAFDGSKRRGTKFDPCPSICSNGEW